jgi:2-dehydro-3-deoxyphosphogluconate aldolase/(4S)-4-hydroxy-2-oxoglutarate aldolase
MEVSARPDREGEAARVIERVADAVPEAVIGASHVPSPEVAEKLADAGARFLSYAPGLGFPDRGQGRVKAAVFKSFDDISDAVKAMETGTGAIRFAVGDYPGSIERVIRVSSIYKSVGIILEGSLAERRMEDCLRVDGVLACVRPVPDILGRLRNEGPSPEDGSSVPPVLGSGTGAPAFGESGAGKWADSLRDEILGLTLAHVGVNAKPPLDFDGIAGLFARITRMPLIKTNESVTFIGSAIEIAKEPSHGAFGHIALATPSVERARYYMGLAGLKFDDGSTVRDDEGRQRLVYLKDEVAGFAVHLRRSV